MTDTRIITCDACNGDRGFESMPYGVNHINGEPLTHWSKCTTCDGRGEIEVETQPAEEDDDPPREELPNCIWRGAATPFAENH